MPVLIMDGQYLVKEKSYIPIMVSVLHCKISVYRERNLLPSTGDSVC